MRRGAIIGVAIGVAAALGFFSQRHFEATPAAAPEQSPQSATAAAPTAAAAPESAATAEAELKIPETLPHFELANRDGRKQSLKDWSGRPLMVNYWATWCGPCRREIPLLNQIRAAHAKQRLEIVGIAVDFRDDVLKYATENPISYPLLIGDEDGLVAVKAMGMQPNFPFTVFADSQQRIVALKVGELHQEEADLILERVMAVDAGKLELAKAREEITAGLKEIATRRAAKKAATAG